MVTYHYEMIAVLIPCFTQMIRLCWQTENDLQYSVYSLHFIAKEFNMEISTIKTKIMAFQGKEHVTSKICIGNTVFEQVNNFNYL
jgi:hypothetical protein